MRRRCSSRRYNYPVETELCRVELLNLIVFAPESRWFRSFVPCSPSSRSTHAAAMQREARNIRMRSIGSALPPLTNDSIKGPHCCDPFFSVRLLFVVAMCRRSTASPRWRRAGSIGSRAGSGNCAGGLCVVTARTLRTEFAVATTLATTAAAVLRTRSKHGLAREIDAPLRVDLHHFDHARIADLDHVFDLLDALGRELADVDEAFLAGKNLDERTDR